MDQSRLILCDRGGALLFELPPDDVMERTRTEEVNGEHSLAVTTFRVLEKGMRVLTCDARGRWREYVVAGVDEDHRRGIRPIGSYYCEWSLKHDLLGVTVSAMPGVKTPVSASEALAAAISGTSRWRVGRVDVTKRTGASMYDMSAWKALGVLVDAWGGEIDASIEVGLSGVVSRKVDLYQMLGNQTASRRYDYGYDVVGIKRSLPDEPFYCRVSPRGKGEQSGDGYGRKIRISSVNGGKDYLQDDEAAAAFRLPDGKGGWEYPTAIIENGEIGAPDELKAWATDVMHSYTRPRATYDVDVLQNHEEGADPLGVSLGDAAHVVDRTFCDGGLRINGRVLRLVVDELQYRRIDATIGSLKPTVNDLLKSYTSGLRSDVATLMDTGRSAAEFLDDMLGSLNREINALGGYIYITQGQGLRAYDKAVSDPLVGAEADKVVEMKGGAIRIADSRTAQGEWEWRTVFVSGHVAADLVTAANLTAGYIGNAEGSYWDLDNDVLQIATTANIGDRTVLEALAGIDATITDVTIEYAQNQSEVNPPTGGWSPTAPTWRDGYYIWQRVATTYGTGDEGATVRSEPTCISGADGERGVGIKSIREQYYLSTSNTEQVGGDWSFNQTAWQPNHFIWIRSYITWDDDTTTTTTAVLAQAINAASQAADDAAKVATNYLTFDSTNGLDVGYSGTSAKTRINGNGMEVFDGDGVSALFAGLESSKSIVRVGRASNSGNVVMSSDGYVDIRSGSTILAHIGYGDGTDASGGTSAAPYYILRTVSSDMPSTVGNDSMSECLGIAYGYASHAEGSGRAKYRYSHAEGEDTEASGTGSHAEGTRTRASRDACHAEGEGTTASGQYYGMSHAEGYNSSATGDYSHAEGYECRATKNGSHAEGMSTTASGSASHAEGFATTASGTNSHASGTGTKATSGSQFVCGRYNSESGTALFIVGSGREGTSAGSPVRRNCFSAGESQISMFSSSNTGTVYVNGSSVHSSDRRLKDHVGYLGEDATEFVRALRPVRYRWKGEDAEHYGFYAQDVRDADPNSTSTVVEDEDDGGLGFNSLSLDYTALIAPLVAYAQSLEKRIEALEEKLA